MATGAAEAVLAARCGRGCLSRGRVVDGQDGTEKVIVAELIGTATVDKDGLMGRQLVPKSFSMNTNNPELLIAKRINGCAVFFYTFCHAWRGIYCGLIECITESSNSKVVINHVKFNGDANLDILYNSTDNYYDLYARLTGSKNAMAFYVQPIFTASVEFSLIPATIPQGAIECKKILLDPAYK